MFKFSDAVIRNLVIRKKSRDHRAFAFGKSKEENREEQIGESLRVTVASENDTLESSDEGETRVDDISQSAPRSKSLRQSTQRPLSQKLNQGEAQH